MKRWALQPDKSVEKLIRSTGIRFYKTTKTRTYRSFLIELGKNNLDKFLLILLADRKGNDATKDKPLYTQEYLSMKKILTELNRDQVYIEDLKLPNKYVPWKIKRELVALVQLNPSKNNTEYLNKKIDNWSK